MLTLYTVSGIFFRSHVLNDAKKLVIFEDLNETYVSANMAGCKHELLEAEPIRVPSAQVAEALAEASLGLQYLSAAFIIDAGKFGRYASRIGYGSSSEHYRLPLTISCRTKKQQKLIGCSTWQHKQSSRCRDFREWSSGMGDLDMRLCLDTRVSRLLVARLSGVEPVIFSSRLD
jgi:hypothetical protein